jgi:THO complex subunit 3
LVCENICFCFSDGSATSSSSSSSSLRVVTGSKDRSIRVWDASKGRSLHTIECSKDPVCLAWRPGTATLAVANSNDEVSFVELDGDQVVAKCPRGKRVCDAEINEIVWLPDSAVDGVPQRLAVASGTKSIEIVSYPDLDVLRSLDGHTSTLYCMSVTADGSRMASGAADTFVCLWDSDELYCTGCVGDLSAPPKCISYAGDGEFIAVAHDEPLVTICDGATGESVGVIEAPSEVSVVAWHPKRMVVAYADQGNKEKGEFVIHVTGFVVVADGEQLPSSPR